MITSSELRELDFTSSDFDLEEVPDEVQELAQKLYYGLHPALRAIGVSYGSREDEAKRKMVGRINSLVQLTGDTAAADAVLNAIFD